MKRITTEKLCLSLNKCINVIVYYSLDGREKKNLCFGRILLLKIRYKGAD